VRINRLFAVALAGALMLGASAPAMAAGKSKGKTTAPGQTKQKPVKKAKKTKAGVSGGGVVDLGEFSIQARLRSPDKGHFNYTSSNGAFKVRCKGFTPYDPATVSPTYPRSVSVTFQNCSITGQTGRGPLTVAVTDNGQPTETQDGQPAATPVATDAVSFSMPGPLAADGTPSTTMYGGNLTDGNVKIR
jgi:hypothetical protein